MGDSTGKPAGNTSIRARGALTCACVEEAAEFSLLYSGSEKTLLSPLLCKGKCECTGTFSRGLTAPEPGVPWAEHPLSVLGNTFDGRGVLHAPPSAPCNPVLPPIRRRPRWHSAVLRKCGSAASSPPVGGAAPLRVARRPLLAEAEVARRGCSARPHRRRERREYREAGRGRLWAPGTPGEAASHERGRSRRYLPCGAGGGRDLTRSGLWLFASCQACSSPRRSPPGTCPLSPAWAARAGPRLLTRLDPRCSSRVRSVWRCWRVP